METAVVVEAGKVVVVGPEDMRPALAAWLLTLRSQHSRMAYATDVGYRYSDPGDGTYGLRRVIGDYAWCDFLDRAGVSVLDADETHVNLWLDDLRRRALMESTVARKLVAISSLYRYLVRRRILRESPVAFVDRPEVDRDESSTQGPDLAQARSLLLWTSQCGRARDHALVCVLLLAGLRVSELIKADIEDIGIDRGHRTLRVTRKGGKIRRVVLVPDAWVALSAYLGNRTSGPLFLRHDGERLSRSTASGMVTRAAKFAKVSEQFTAHSLRHGFATLSLEAGVALTDLQDAMGHADPRTTRRYDRARNRLDKHPGYELAALLAGRKDA